MIEAQYARAIDLLDNNKEKLTILAKLLLEKEVIFKDDLEKVFGKRPFDEVEEKIEEIIEEEVKVSPVEKDTEE
jgi:cell division protease FtsH